MSVPADTPGDVMYLPSSTQRARPCQLTFVLWLVAQATTHLARCKSLAAQFPRTQVETDPIFVRDGNVWTSAGVTAGIDLTLELIEQDLGRPKALAVARSLVMFVKRPGDQAQFSAPLRLQQAEDRFDDLHAWISANLPIAQSVGDLADHLGMSERSFSRRYRAATGETPAKALDGLRLTEARRMAEDTDLSIKDIAYRCGYGATESMRRSFLRALGVPPQDYRSRFQVGAGSGPSLDQS